MQDTTPFEKCTQMWDMKAFQGHTPSSAFKTFKKTRDSISSRKNIIPCQKTPYKSDMGMRSWRPSCPACLCSLILPSRSSFSHSYIKHFFSRSKGSGSLLLHPKFWFTFLLAFHNNPLEPNCTLKYIFFTLQPYSTVGFNTIFCKLTCTGSPVSQFSRKKNKTVLSLLGNFWHTF